MTFLKCKNVTKGLLVGDNALPTREEGVVEALLEMALHRIAEVCPVLTLQTLDQTENIKALSRGDYMIRIPKTPESDTDELDIDDELGFVAARLIASYVSKDKKDYHKNEAILAMRAYNAKVYDLQDSLNPKGTSDDV